MTTMTTARLGILGRPGDGPPDEWERLEFLFSGLGLRIMSVPPWTAYADDWIDDLDGVLLPSVEIPRMDRRAQSCSLVRRAMGRAVPVLAVGAGAVFLNEALGGRSTDGDAPHLATRRRVRVHPEAKLDVDVLDDFHDHEVSIVHPASCVPIATDGIDNTTTEAAMLAIPDELANMWPEMGGRTRTPWVRYWLTRPDLVEGHPQMLQFAAACRQHMEDRLEPALPPATTF